MIAIYKRELKSYFFSVIGWLFIAFLLLFAGIFTSMINLHTASASFEYVISNTSIVFLLAIPVLTMKSVADEQTQKTDKLLYSLPIKTSSIIIGKYLSMVTIIGLTIAIIGFYPLILSIFGEIDMTLAYTSLLGLFLLGSALAAIGMFVSSLTENMVTSAVISFTAILLLYMLNSAVSVLPNTALGSLFCFFGLFAVIGVIVYVLSKSYFLGIITAAAGIIPTFIVYLFTKNSFKGLFPSLVSYLAVFDRLYNFVMGIFDVTAIVYYISVIVFFVFLTMLSFEKKRWN